MKRAARLVLEEHTSRAESAAPFLKWAGGKRQLLPQLRRFYPDRFTMYLEPFLGSAAVFFDLQAAGAIAERPAFLVDSNGDLIGCYHAIRTEVDEVIRLLRDLERAHHRRGSDHYYEIRDRRFNPHRAALWAAERSTPGTYGATLAAQLIYLNRTCFNGLFRQNARGEFNVPVGRYTNPRICDESNLRRVAAVLNSGRVTLRHASFEVVLEIAGPGAFVYLDPPYAPISDTSHFRSYTADGFSPDDQERLQSVVIELARRGCSVVLSNSVAPQIVELYEKSVTSRRAGLRAYRVPARRAINCDGSSRGTVEEYIVTNIERPHV